eukprot:TRINITY_DN18271_c0_g1_i1.p1 TRINITY_DN18271_c0_g1~~TRINITY_DN18271_c0_g1_i1.p1  ORF type:complete len:225 (+),score=18.69 TRINITY_DN18271_c0_g1_i1:168-842(+)
MLLPMGMFGAPLGSEITPEMKRYLQFVTFVVVWLYICGVFLLMSGDLMGALVKFFMAIAGTYLQRDDPTLTNCFKCLQETPVQVCDDGRGAAWWLSTFMVTCGFDGLFSIIQVSGYLSSGAELVPCVSKILCFLPLLSAITSVVEVVGCVLCWKAWRVMQDPFEGSSTSFSGGAYAHPENPPANLEAAEIDPVQGSTTAGTSSWTFANRHQNPFPGQGYRLGDA